MKLSQMDLNTLLAMSPEKKWEFICGEIKDDGETADVAILLGCWPEIATERAKAAAQLYLAGRVKHIIASGGVTWEYCGGQISEADLMKQVLMEEGVPEDAILLDLEARTTKENMICSTLVLNRTLKLEHIDSVIIVTSQNHMQRSLALAKALLPRKLHISGFPSYHKETKEEWLALEKNREIQDKCIQLLKGLVDTRIVEDMEVNIEL